MTRLVYMLSLFTLVSGVLAGPLCSDAYAAPPKKAAADRRGAAEAKEHAAAGYRLYALGKYLEASAEFESAYQTKPDGGLLYNAAQSARLGGDLKKARTLYGTYVSFHPDGPNVADAKNHLEKLDQQIQLEETAKKNAPPQPAHVDQPSTGDETTGEPQQAQRSDRPIVKKWWFWTAIIGGAAVVATAVTLGILLSRPAPKWSNVSDIGPGATTTMSVTRPLLEAHF